MKICVWQYSIIFGGTNSMTGIDWIDGHALRRIEQAVETGTRGWPEEKKENTAEKLNLHETITVYERLINVFVISWSYVHKAF